MCDLNPYNVNYNINKKEKIFSPIETKITFEMKYSLNKI